MCLRKLRLFFPFVLLILAHFRRVDAVCNVCVKPFNVACVSNTQFKFCDGDVPADPLNSCPSGYVCAHEVGICQPKTTSVPLQCNDCNQCDDDLVYACTGPTTFALCLGKPEISNITGTCADSLVCIKDSKQICAPSVLGATCSLSEAPVTPTPTAATTATPTPTAKPTQAPVDTTAICNVIQQIGNFPYGINVATTCRQYFRCFLRGGAWGSTVFTCPGRTYFDSSTGTCTPSVPPRCTVYVASLQILEHNLA